MDITWKYKIDVADAAVFAEVEKERGITFPEELKALILEANAATPSKHLFMVGTAERVLGAVLSFNHNESDTDSIFTALNAVEERNLLPFAIDPFGNYICYTLKDGQIVFWDHETDGVTSTGLGLQTFLASLY